MISKKIEYFTPERIVEDFAVCLDYCRDINKEMSFFASLLKELENKGVLLVQCIEPK